MATPVKIMPPIDITYAKLTASNVAETEYGNYSSGTTYALGDRVIVPATHDVWESLAAANNNHTPVDGGAWWSRVGPTNRMAMVDGTISSKTTRSGGIDVTVTPGETIDTLVLLNVDTASARVRMTDPVDGVAFDKTFDMIEPVSEADFYTWCFEPIERKDFLVVTLPPYGTADVRVELIDSGTASCGVLSLGFSRKIGEGTLAGARIGFDDYSGKTRNTWGQLELVERDYSDKASISTIIMRDMVDPVSRLLKRRHASPTVCIFSDYYSCLVLYGLVSFDVTIPYNTHSMCNIEVEGLT